MSVQEKSLFVQMKDTSEWKTLKTNFAEQVNLIVIKFLPDWVRLSREQVKDYIEVGGQ